LGLRAKEIASLTIADVADSHYQLLNELSLKRSMTKGEKQRQAYLTHKKIREVLQAHVNDLKHIPRNKALFQTQRKSRFTANSLQKWFRAFMIKQEFMGQALIRVGVLLLRDSLNKGRISKRYHDLRGMPILSPPRFM
jgi:integrase/recombinase XerD